MARDLGARREQLTDAELKELRSRLRRGRRADRAAIQPAPEAAEPARQPFELERAPLLRGLLMRLGDRERVLVLSFHHIVTDGWSQAVFTRELSELYAGAELGELPLQYGDYAHWQREWLSGGELERQLGYWRGGLGRGGRLRRRPRPLARARGGGRRGRRRR